MKNIIIKKYNIKNNKLISIFKINKNNKIILFIKETFKSNKKNKYLYKKLIENNINIIIPKLKLINKNKNFNKYISDKKILLIIHNFIIWIKNKYKIKKISIIGLNWGGRISLLYSYLYEKNINYLIILWNKIIYKKNNTNQIHPIDVINKFKIPILFIYSKKNKNKIKNLIKINNLTKKNIKNIFLNKENKKKIYINIKNFLNKI